LVVSGNTLYGTVYYGLSPGVGYAFALHTDGTDFNILCSLPLPLGNYGQQYRGLNFSGNRLFATSSRGGPTNNGTIFSISLLPNLTIAQSGTNTILSWPATSTGFTLQSTPSLFPTGTWGTVFPGPVDLNGQNTVTNPISGAQQFYRLVQ
jgi:hypothetical protein